MEDINQKYLNNMWINEFSKFGMELFNVVAKCDCKELYPIAEQYAKNLKDLITPSRENEGILLDCQALFDLSRAKQQGKTLESLLPNYKDQPIIYTQLQKHFDNIPVYNYQHPHGKLDVSPAEYVISLQEDARLLAENFPLVPSIQNDILKYFNDAMRTHPWDDVVSRRPRLRLLADTVLEALKKEKPDQLASVPISLRADDIKSFMFNVKSMRNYFKNKSTIKCGGVFDPMASVKGGFPSASFNVICGVTGGQKSRTLMQVAWGMTKSNPELVEYLTEART